MTPFSGHSISFAIHSFCPMQQKSRCIFPQSQGIRRDFLLTGVNAPSSAPIMTRTPDSYTVPSGRVSLLNSVVKNSTSVACLLDAEGLATKRTQRLPQPTLRPRFPKSAWSFSPLLCPLLCLLKSFLRYSFRYFCQDCSLYKFAAKICTLRFKGCVGSVL